jgi:hypothetical protein
VHGLFELVGLGWVAFAIRSVLIFIEVEPQPSIPYRSSHQAPIQGLMYQVAAAAGLEFSHLYRLCRERFLVGNEMALRSHLTEFSDHRMIATK